MIVLIFFFLPVLVLFADGAAVTGVFLATSRDVGLCRRLVDSPMAIPFP